MNKSIAITETLISSKSSTFSYINSLNRKYFSEAFIFGSMHGKVVTSHKTKSKGSIQKRFQAPISLQTALLIRSIR